MLVLKDLNLIRTNSFYKAETFKAFVAEALFSPVKALTEKAHTEFFLKNINLTLTPGERVAILGKNGSGKSTLCKVIASQLFASSGQMNCSFNVSLFSQLENTFFKDLSGKENLKYFIKFIYRETSTKEQTQILKNASEFSGLGAALDRQINTYSTGMLGRLALSLILAQKHDLLILDEMQKHTDQQFRTKVKDKLADVIHSSKAVIIVSHDLEDIVDVCERGIVIDGGSIVFDGPFAKALGVYNLLSLGGKNE
ncbi:MAG: ABC transporter ATP-binding protein [Pseudobdellovibrio sp.]